MPTAWPSFTLAQRAQPHAKKADTSFPGSARECFNSSVCYHHLLFSTLHQNMVTENVLCVPRSDSEGDYILVNATSNGPSPLDLRILATEGEAPYVAKRELRVLSNLA